MIFRTCFINALIVPHLINLSRKEMIYILRLLDLVFFRISLRNVWRISHGNNFNSGFFYKNDAPKKFKKFQPAKINPREK